MSGLRTLLAPIRSRVDDLPAFQRDVLASALEPDRSVDPPRFALAVATLGLLAAEGERRPVLAVVDDGHRLDVPSAQTLAFAARRLRSESVVMVVASRRGERTPFGLGTIERMVLDGLPVEEAEELLAAAVRGPVARAVAVELVAATGGNPAALLEVARRLDPAALQGRLPLPALSLIGDGLHPFSHRLEELPDATRAALVVAASSSDSVAVVDLALGEMGLGLSMLEPAEAVGIVRLEQQHLHFEHPLLRSSVTARATPQELRAAHATLARACHAVGDQNGEMWHVTAAASGPDEQTAEALERIGATAEQVGDPATAADARERAALLTPPGPERGRRLVSAAAALLLAGRPDHVLELLEKATTFDVDVVTRAVADRLRGQVEVLGGSPSDGFEILAPAARAVAAGNPSLAVTLLLDASVAALMDLRLDDAVTVAREARDLASRTDGALRRRASSVLAGALLLRGDATGGREAVDSVDGFARSVGRTPFPYSEAGTAAALILLERYDEAVELLDESIAHARHDVAPARLPFELAHRSGALYCLGRWREAEAAASEAAERARDTGQAAMEAIAAVARARVAAGRGEDEACRTHVNAALSRGAVVKVVQPLAGSALCLSLLGRGRPAEAAIVGQRVMRVWASAGMRHPWMSSCGVDLVEALLLSGRRADAWTSLEHLATEADAARHTTARAAVLRCRGMLTRTEEAEAHFAGALELMATTTQPFEAARTQLAYGAWLRRHGRRTEARGHLRLASSTFDGLGAVPWSDRARRELRASGERVTEGPAAVAGVLTPPELRVALAVAGGGTNSEAAKRLFLSEKTVEFHLSAIYRKLGVRSRSELARRVAEIGLSVPVTDG